MDVATFTDIVERASTRVEDETGARIGADAKAVLISRAVEHSDDVEAAIARERLGTEDLVRAAAQQLREALGLPPQQQQQQQQMQQQQQQQQQFDGPRQTIGEADVRRGMARRCWFVPWC